MSYLVSCDPIYTDGVPSESEFSEIIGWNYRVREANAYTPDWVKTYETREQAHNAATVAMRRSHSRGERSAVVA